jgi:predicted transcriptional regulator
MSKQIAPYSLRLPPDLRRFYQRQADELERSLHWVIVRVLDSVASEGACMAAGAQSEKSTEDRSCP